MRTRSVTRGISAIAATLIFTITVGSSSDPLANPKHARGFHTVKVAGELFERDLGIAIKRQCRDRSHCRQRIFSTADLGRTWRNIAPNVLGPEDYVSDIVALDPNDIWFTTDDCAGARAFLYRSRDGGKSWTRSRIDSTSCSAGSTIEIDFVDADRGWMLHRAGSAPFTTVSRTDDGGQTWSTLMTKHDLFIESFRDRGYGYLVRDVISSGARVTEDGGQTWMSHAVCSTPGWKRSIFHQPVFLAHAAVLPIPLRKGDRAALGFCKSPNGESWRTSGVLRLRSGAGKYVRAPSIPNQQHWWALDGDVPFVYLTRDSGRSWSEQRLPFEGAQRITAIGGRTAWITAYRKGHMFLYRTTNYGRRWRAVVPSS